MTKVKLWLYAPGRGPVLHEQRDFRDHYDACRFEKERGQRLADLFGWNVSGAFHYHGSPNPSGGGYYQPRT